MAFNPQQVIKARDALNWTQEQLSEEINKIAGGGISAQTVSNWERGKSSPTVSNFDALVKVTGKTHGFFFEQAVSESSTNPTTKKERAA